MKSQGRIDRKLTKDQFKGDQLFLLKFSGQGSGSKFDTEVDFSIRSVELKEQENDQKLGGGCSSIPRFNKDGNHKTSAFQLGPEKIIFNSNDQLSESSFSFKNEKLREESEQMMIAKPVSTFCRVCESFFQDYLNHIKRKDHISNLKKVDRKIKMTQLITYFEKKNTKKWRRYESVETEKRKIKVRLIEDPISYTPVAINLITKNQSPYNSSLTTNTKTINTEVKKTLLQQ